LGLTGNPDTAEAVMVQRDLEIANSVNSRLHVPHVSTKLAVDQIRQMKTKSKNVTAEVTPHHLYFSDSALTTYNTNLKVAPPIRTEDDRKALIDALDNNIIDCIATDHAPHTIEEKEAPFELAPFGMIGLESCFGAVNKVLNNHFGIEKIIDLLTKNPRDIMGFDSTLFEKNTEAEISIIDPNKKWTFSKDDIHSRSINSPFIGEDLIGKVKYTIVKGMLAEV
jgi:dihydroorotase